MNKDLEKLKNILSEISYSGDQHDHILIKEDDRLASLRSVTLNMGNKSKNWFAFSPDKILHKNKQKNNRHLIGISPLLTLNKSIKHGKDESTESHHNETCDCVVFLLESNQLKLIFIELKSSLIGNNQKAINQIKSTEQFSKYLLGLASTFYQVNFKTSHHHVVFHNTHVRKTRTVPKNITNQLLKTIQISNSGTVFLKQII
jgi:hypothetical protein